MSDPTPPAPQNDSGDVSSVEPTLAVDPDAVALGTLDIEQERAVLAEISQRPLFGRLRGYLGLSGPGWLQSAITLGGGSLAGSLFLGIIAGYSMMWVQPLAMILGIIMLSAIGYVTLSTGERPFGAINEHVNPVLGWAWILASMAANIVWCLPQYSLAFGVLSQTFAAPVFGDAGALNSIAGEGTWLASNAAKLVASLIILTVCTVITWSYDRGGLGIKIYEIVLKILVASIVLCFIGVVIRLTFTESSLPWDQIFAGFVPDFGAFFRPADTYVPMLSAIENEAARGYWSDLIISNQQDVIATAAATAVGINMTFLFPYSLLRKGWDRNYRGLTIFDLSTGMFIPFVLATSCVVLASASFYHASPITLEDGQLPASVLEDKNYGKAVEARQNAAETEGSKLPADLSIAEQQLAASLRQRSANDLAKSLSPLTGDFFAKIIFGFGVVAMTLSTISILMLINGFVFTEIFDAPAGGPIHRAGMLLAGVAGAFGPFIWSGASFYLAVPTSVFGLMLLPIAYISFFFLMNSKTFLGKNRPEGGRRFVWNTLMIVALTFSSVAALYMVHKKAGVYGLAGIGVLILAAIVVHFVRNSSPSVGGDS